MEFSEAYNMDGKLFVPYSEAKQQIEEYKKELENNSKELEIYKKAFEYACYRLESLDMGNDYSWKARTWKKVILEKVREEE